jgi:hypothetical protein
MSDAVEVGSLAGTWVAAGVAIIALIGVLGPLLVWRAMRTERHQAIDRLSQGGADTAGYVSTGVRVTSTIRLFRHFNAPNLRSAPSLRASTLNWDDNTTLVDSNSASWVQLERCSNAITSNAPRPDHWRFAMAKSGCLFIEYGSSSWVSWGGMVKGKMRAN